MPYKVNPQFVSTGEVEGGEALEEEKKTWQTTSRNFAKRKYGSLKARGIKPPRKKRRVKAMLTGFLLNNMVRQYTGKTLLHYKIVKGKDGKYPDPFTWPSINLSPDMGPDEVCFDSWAVYCASLNSNADYDLCHGLKNAGKGTLKHCGQWPFVVLMTSAQNVVYGSLLSPARLQQIREAWESYFTTANKDDEVFQFFLPMLVKQLPIEVSMADQDCDEVIIFMCS